MWTIRQTGDRWELVRGDSIVSDHGSYDVAVQQLAALLEADADAAPASGELPERWHSTTGIAFQEQPDPERDFTACTWSFRDPAVYRLPLMLQTTTEMGHFGAVLAGFIDAAEIRDGVPFASGGFYASDAGTQFRDMLASGHRFGVSVDPTAAVDAEWECTEEDDDGWCVAGVVRFLSYEIGGLTGTPFPAFQNATIELDAGEPATEDDDVEDHDDEEVEPEAISASAAWDRLAGSYDETTAAAPLYPPTSWFEMPEPDEDSDLLVEQRDGSLSVPLTITDDGRVFGHMARWNQCHVAYPGGPEVCTSPPPSPSGYADFHLGVLRTEEGTDLAVGALFVGCDHPALSMSAPDARDAYANTGAAWADVRIIDGALGPWVCGALRPYVSELQIRLLRASSLSGDWRPPEPGADHLEAVACLAVTVPGFPQRRYAAAMAASAGTVHALPRPASRLAWRTTDGQIRAMVASSMVERCPDCEARQATTRLSTTSDDRLDQVLARLAVIERRTRHLNAPAAAALARRITG